MNERLFGVDRRRSLPRWQRRTFAQLAEADVRDVADVLLFNDTFTNYYNPAVGMAGVQVLESLGLAVTLAPNVCCGRPLISQGLLDEARRQALLNTLRLFAAAERGTTIAFFEPSCLSAIAEDTPALLRGSQQQRALTVASRARLFEEVVEERCQAGASLALSSGPAKIVLHGHCHQKAMGRVAPARALLARVPGAAVVDLDSGCCGMAGSFGYHREHFDVSRAIAERRLLPAARQLGADAVLVASGVSCRHQVADFTGVRALHPAELLQSLMDTETA
jgi:Fe-S oxidoreductase